MDSPWRRPSPNCGKLGAPGFTLVPEVRGAGDRDDAEADELSAIPATALVLIACDDQAMVNYPQAVRPAFQGGGICLRIGSAMAATLTGRST